MQVTLFFKIKDYRQRALAIENRSNPGRFYDGGLTLVLKLLKQTAHTIKQVV
jgi:hypothetical protein